MKVKFLALCSIFLTSCGNDSTTVKTDGKTADGEFQAGQEFGMCSSSGQTSMTCENGVTMPLPPTFPNIKDCNQCLTKIEEKSIGGKLVKVAMVKCPNGLSFEFELLKGEKGDRGDVGQKGDRGSDGKNGTSCSVTADGWVKCTDNTSYKLEKGPKGDSCSTSSVSGGVEIKCGETKSTILNGKDGQAGRDGSNGRDGVGCTTFKNSLGQVVVKCGDKEEVITGCGGGGCWSYGSQGNVFRLVPNTSTLPNFDTMIPVATAKVADFSIFDAPSSGGLPGVTYSPAFPDKEWYGIRWQGFLEIQSAPQNNVCFRLTSDDGARFSLGTSNVEVVAMPNLQPPSSKTGCVAALPGRHSYRLDYFQGPRVQVALALEVSYDGGATYRLVATDELTHIVK